MIRVTNYLLRAARAFSNKPAVIYEDKQYTWKEFYERACKVANALYGLGLKQGDIASICLAKVTSQAIEICWGCHKSGIVIQQATPAPVVVKGEVVLPYALNTVGSKVLFYDAPYKSLVDSVRSEIRTVQHFINLDEPTYEELVTAAPSADPGYSPEDSDLLVIHMTTGTAEGVPKICPVDHRFMAVEQVNAWSLLTFPDPETDRFLNSVPTYWGGTLQAQNLAATLQGITQILPGDLTPANILRVIEEKKPTTMYISPELITAMAHHPDIGKRDLTSLKRMTFLGALPDIEVWKRITEACGKKVLTRGTGQVEPGMGPLHLYPEDYEVEGAKAKRVQSLGHDANPYMHADAMDEQGNLCEEGEIGELVYSNGPGWRGLVYWEEPEKSREVHYGGWFHSGDFVRYEVDEGKRYFYLVGRKEEMISTQGKIAAPKEIERIIAEHPAIREVGICSIPDKEFGEAIVANIVLREGKEVKPEDIVALCKSKLPSHCAPKYVDFVESLPKTYKEYVITRQLREEAKRRHGV